MFVQSSLYCTHRFTLNAVLLVVLFLNSAHLHPEDLLHLGRQEYFSTSFFTLRSRKGSQLLMKAGIARVSAFAMVHFKPAPTSENLPTCQIISALYSVTSDYYIVIHWYKNVVNTFLYGTQPWKFKTYHKALQELPKHHMKNSSLAYSSTATMKLWLHIELIWQEQTYFSGIIKCSRDQSSLSEFWRGVPVIRSLWLDLNSIIVL